MRKLLDEKFIFCKMSNIRLKENNRLFCKAESGSSGSCERAAGNNRNPGVSGMQKRRDRCEEKHKGSIDSHRPVEKSLKNSEIKAKSKKKHENTQRESDTMHNCNLSDYPYVLCSQHYSGMHMHRQQMFFSNYLSNGVNLPPCLITSAFSRSLSEPAVLCHQLSNVCFNSYGNYNRNPGVRMNKTSSYNKSVNNMRSWQFTNLGKVLEKLSGGRNPGITFKIMTYNVLAQDLLMVHPELYRENDKKMLEWELRWRNIYKDIREHNCEIVCLQEVQQNHLEKYYNTLETLGYKGIYKKRTGHRTDGCAIYYKTNIFNLVEYVTVEYLQPNISVLDRDNVGIVATFTPKSKPDVEFIVATTHLLYNPRRNDVRLAQMQILLTEIERLAYRYNRSESRYIPVILTGDLNTEPKTAVYNFIVKSVLKYENMVLRSNQVAGKMLIPPWLMITDNCQHAGLLKFRIGNKQLTRADEEKYIRLVAEDRKVDFTNQSDYDKYQFASGTLTHNFVFKSAYKHGSEKDAEGSTYQTEWITVDYIFYSGFLDGSKNFKDDKLKLLSRFTLPTKQQLIDTKIPDLEQGSDHLALLACFKLEY